MTLHFLYATVPIGYGGACTVPQGRNMSFMCPSSPLYQLRETYKRIFYGRSKTKELEDP